MKKILVFLTLPFYLSAMNSEQRVQEGPQKGIHLDLFLAKEYGNTYNTLSPDGRFLFIQGEQESSLVARSDGFLWKRFQDIRAHAFSPNSQLLYVEYRGKHDMRDGQSSLSGPSSGQLFELSPDPREKKTFQDIMSVTFSPYGKFLYAQHKQDRGTLLCLEKLEVLMSFKDIKGVAFGPGNKVLVLEYLHNAIRLMSMADQSMTQLIRSVLKTRFSRDGANIILDHPGHRSTLLELDALDRFSLIAQKLLLKVYQAAKQNEKIELTEDELATYQSLGDHTKAKIRKFITLP